MVEDGDPVLFDLYDLFLGKPEISAKGGTRDFWGIRRDTASRIEYERTDTVLDTLLPQS